MISKSSDNVTNFEDFRKRRALSPTATVDVDKKSNDYLLEMMEQLIVLQHELRVDEESYTGETHRGGAAEMGDEWLKILVEKMDQDKRESDARMQAGLDRIEHLLERSSDQSEATKREIQEQNDKVNARIDKAYTVFVGSSIATFLAVAALVVTIIISVIPLLKGPN